MYGPDIWKGCTRFDQSAFGLTIVSNPPGQLNQEGDKIGLLKPAVEHLSFISTTSNINFCLISPSPKEPQMQLIGSKSSTLKSNWK